MPRPNIDRLYARASELSGMNPRINFQLTSDGFCSDEHMARTFGNTRYATATDAICAALWRIIIDHRPANAPKGRLPRVLRQTKAPR